MSNEAGKIAHKIIHPEVCQVCLVLMVVPRLLVHILSSQTNKVKNIDPCPSKTWGCVHHRTEDRSKSTNLGVQQNVIFGQLYILKISHPTGPDTASKIPLSLVSLSPMLHLISLSAKDKASSAARQQDSDKKRCSAASHFDRGRLVENISAIYSAKSRLKKLDQNWILSDTN